MKNLTLSLLAAIPFLVPAPAEATLIAYVAGLCGDNESPPVVSTGSGMARLTIDTTVHALTLEVDFADLVGTTTVAHIHGPTAVAGEGNAGVITQVPSFVDFPSGVSSGVYVRTFDLTDASTYNAAFLAGAGGGTVVGAEGALLAALADGEAYLNIHTTFAPSGEIRGFFRVAPVPEPGATVGLLALGLLGCVVFQQYLRRPSEGLAAG